MKAFVVVEFVIVVPPNEALPAVRLVIYPFVVVALTNVEEVAERLLAKILPVKLATPEKTLDPLKTESLIVAFTIVPPVRVPLVNVEFSIVVPLRYPIVEAPINVCVEGVLTYCVG